MADKLTVYNDALAALDIEPLSDTGEPDRRDIVRLLNAQFDQTVAHCLAEMTGRKETKH